MPIVHANKIRNRRLAHSPRLRQDDLARLVGCGRSEVSDYEQGKVIPNLPRALALAAVLHVSVPDLFFELSEAVLDQVTAETCKMRSAAAETREATTP